MRHGFWIVVRRFLIASHGWSGSYWLAHVLHAQPGIACVHSSAALPADAADPYSLDAILEKGTLADVYARLEVFRNGYRDRATRRPSELCDDVAERFPEAALVGSVHTFRMRDLSNAFDDLGAAGLHEDAISVANLLRHPVTLVQSGYGQFRDSMGIDLNEHAWVARRVIETDLHGFEAISARHGVRPGTFDALSFLGACCALVGPARDFGAAQSLAERADVRWLGHMQMERIVSEPDHLAAWIDRLSGGALQMSPEGLAAMNSGSGRNRHNRASGGGTVEEVLAGWSDWQRDVFIHCLDLFALRAPYAEAGYDLSMVPHPGANA